MWRFLRILCFGIYGAMAPLWFGWNIVEPKFWAMLILMVFACVCASEEEGAS